MNKLHKQTYLRVKKLKTPIEVELGDGSLKYVRRLVSIDMELATKAGSIMLRKVEYRVLPGASSELLIGKTELDRLEPPSLEKSLEAAILRVCAQSGVGAFAVIVYALISTFLKVLLRLKYSMWSDRRELSSRRMWWEGKWTAMSVHGLVVPMCWGKNNPCFRRALVFVRRLSPEIYGAK